MDIYQCAVSQQRGLQGHNELFINTGKSSKGVPSFSEKSAEYGLNFSGHSTQAAFFDFDHDGDLDCYLLNQSLQPNQNIRPATNRTEFNPLSGDRFYRNEGGKKFTDISKDVGIYQGNLGYGLGISVGDFNNDGWDDVYIGNDFHENDYYYLNSGKGFFVESGESHFRHYSRFSMGNDAADYDNDGDLDLITVDMLPDDEKVLKTYGSDENSDSYQYKIISNGYQHQSSRNCLQQNNGNGESFSEVGLMAAISATDWSWSPLFADFDNDGNKDLAISSGIVKRPVDLDYVKYISDLYIQKGMDKSDKYDEDALDKMPDGASHPFIFKGDGKGAFKDVSEAFGTADLKGYFNGTAYGDLDNDGDLDLVINRINAPATILRNNSTQKGFSIACEGTKLNRFGIGTKVYVFANGQMQHQQLMATRGFQSSSESKLHFSVGSNSTLDSVFVVWPDQTYQVLKNIAFPKTIVVKQREAKGTFSQSLIFKQTPIILENSTAQYKIDWQHTENPFNEYNTQPLIPHKLSTRGPKIAVGDINADGLDDFYVCGASGQAGALFLQQTNGSFKRISEAVFSADALCEDVDAVFLDANNDGKQDLYVVSGGNEFETGNTLLGDRLYLNLGGGKFQKAINALPSILVNKSCVSVADVDKDGDSDLFVGVTAETNKYGLISESYLLLNKGKGHFNKADESIISLKNAGMITASAFADINKDGYSDLLVAGEFMPITVFINQKGKFSATTLPKTTGWWQSIYLDDVNSDGNLDILAGNWGYNSKFWSNKNGPVKLYAKDFDQNGKIDQLLSYTQHGKEYPFLAKDELERPLPVLRKHYTRYADFAGLEMKDAFLGFVEQVNPLVAERMGSVVCYGDGKGAFTVADLPTDLQKAPIFSFQKIKPTVYLCGGNFLDSTPYEGRYDAQPLALLDASKKAIHYMHQPSLYNYNGQVWDIKCLKTANGKELVLVAFNNKPLEIFRVK
ncbi:VCBS repeat-containing protein [Spirosoma harenae]